ncbi:hypothetical protein ACTFIV_000645 [Dictyostelium citrinum]
MEKTVTLGEQFFGKTNISFSISYIDNNGVSKTIETSTLTPNSATVSPITAPPTPKPQPPCPYDHLVLVVHGIGSHDKNWVKTIKKMNKKFSSIFYNIQNENFDKRVKFIGTEWHSAVHTSMDDETSLKDVTPKIGIPTVRALIDDTLMDFVMWATPTFAEPIYKEVADQLNSEYSAFIKEYPTFNGKVSILAHSLGSIITYDILTNQPSNSNSDICIPKSASSNSIPDENGAECIVRGNVDLWKSINNYDDEKKEIFHSSFQFVELNFPVYNYYIIGSPVGALLSLRKHKQVPIPKCENFFNIINIYDPVSFLVEPLIDKGFIGQEMQYVPKFTKKLSKLPKKFRSSKKIDAMIVNTPNSLSTHTSPCLLSAQQQLQNVSIVTPSTIIQPINLNVNNTNNNNNINNNNLSTTTITSTTTSLNSTTTTTTTTTIDNSTNSSNSNGDDSSSSSSDDEDDDSGDGSNSGSTSTASSNGKSNLPLADISQFSGCRYDYAMRPKFHITEFGPWLLTAHSSYFLSKEVLNFIGLNLN